MKILSIILKIILAFFALIAILGIYIFISSSYWKLELTNETNNDVVFESDYCPNYGSKHTVGKNSREVFYCFDSNLICERDAKKVCVENIGCDTYWHTDCDGHLGPFLESVKNIKKSTSDLTNNTPSQWTKRINKSTKQEVLALLKTRNENLYLNDGVILKHASDELRKDKEVVLAAYKRDSHSFSHADVSLKKDRSFILSALKYEYMIFDHADKSLKTDKFFILEALEVNPQIPMYLQSGDNDFNTHKDIVLLAITKDPSALNYASHKLRVDKEFIINALKINKETYNYLRNDMQNDIDILKLME